jgi:hypothetical protein
VYTKVLSTKISLWNLSLHSYSALAMQTLADFLSF